MAVRTKKTKDDKSVKNDRITCLECGIDKNLSKYYVSYAKNSTTGKIHYCKDCLRRMISNSAGTVSMNKLKVTLKLIDKPFIASLWQSSIKTHHDAFGVYMKNLSLLQNRLLTWKDSRFDLDQPDAIVSYDEFYSPADSFKLTRDIVDKWGAGYKTEEYEGFERKYNMLKNHYLEKTSMHTEALFKYIRYSVKEELATAANDVEDAKKWGSLAQKAADSAKINPSQLKSEDLNDGLSTFGQLVRAVEQTDDIVEILPQFKSSPNDLPDFILLCYINYIRDLKGMPHVQYKDVWQFYEDRKKEYSDRLDFLDLNDMFGNEGEGDEDE